MPDAGAWGLGWVCWRWRATHAGRAGFCAWASGAVPVRRCVPGRERKQAALCAVLLPFRAAVGTDGRESDRPTDVTRAARTG